MIALKGIGPDTRAFQQCNGYGIYNGLVSALEKKKPKISPSPASPSAREPIIVAILFNLVRKRRVMMKDVDVGNVSPRWTRWGEGESYPEFVVQRRCLEEDSLLVRCQCRW
jgi:hypothetical protein